MLRDDTSGRTYSVVRALVAIDWEITEEFVPFNLVRYETSPAGELLTDAAVVPLDLGSFRGKLMIVYKAGHPSSGRLAAEPERWTPESAREGLDAHRYVSGAGITFTRGADSRPRRRQPAPEVVARYDRQAGKPR